MVLLTIFACALGYLEIRHQAEREIWRGETSALAARMERAERLARERARALSASESDRAQWARSSSRLADLEARILDAAAELARIESERIVAKDRAAKVIVDLKRQIRSLTTIEMDISALDHQRRRLQQHVDAVEERLVQAETGAAERQKRAEALDREIAELAMRREVLSAQLEAGKDVLRAEVADIMLDETIQDADADAGRVAVASPDRQPTGVSPEQAIKPAAAPASAAVSDDATVDIASRSRGLYRFGSLSVEQAALATYEEGGPTSLADPGAPSFDDEVEAANWAEDQYSLGLNLISTGERNSGTRELREAVLAFRAVLGEWPKERDPVRWSMARSDLGYAMALLGKREKDLAMLQDAEMACRDALSHFTPKETPLLWGAAQHHLGVSLSGLAELKDDLGLWQDSIEALKQAASTFKEVGVENDARKVEVRLREAYAKVPPLSSEPLE